MFQGLLQVATADDAKQHETVNKAARLSVSQFISNANENDANAAPDAGLQHALGVAVVAAGLDTNAAVAAAANGAAAGAAGGAAAGAGVALLERVASLKAVAAAVGCVGGIAIVPAGMAGGLAISAAGAKCSGRVAVVTNCMGANEQLGQVAGMMGATGSAVNGQQAAPGADYEALGLEWAVYVRAVLGHEWKERVLPCIISGGASSAAATAARLSLSAAPGQQEQLLAAYEAVRTRLDKGIRGEDDLTPRHLTELLRLMGEYGWDEDLMVSSV